MVAEPKLAEQTIALVSHLIKLKRETPWLEFKENNDDPQEIGEYISALSNAAALEREHNGYLIWGVRDADHAIVGTLFDPDVARKGNEELEGWLLRLLEPRLDLRFVKVVVDGKSIVVLEVPAASWKPVAFSGAEFVRVGSYKKRLREFPEKERALWRLFDQRSFELQVAVPGLAEDDVLRQLDYPAYFELLELPLPEGRAAILESLERDGLLKRDPRHGWSITNLGGILFAKRIDDFPGLSRKAVRVVQYRGRDRTESIREHVDPRGYAAGFSSLLEYLNGILPRTETVGQALRHSVPMFPEIAVRELVANALIHQDFRVTGAGPMIEVFDGRLEITNPGEPLVDINRFLDCPPSSRNEKLAALMRRFRICEERGSGIDKVVAHVEIAQLPPPLFEVPPGFTRAVLFGPRPLTEMDREERVRACYWHACLKYVQRQAVTNTSIRERFGITFANRATASRLIRDALAAKVIVAHDPKAAPSQMKYLPWWASKVVRSKGS